MARLSDQIKTMAPVRPSLARIADVFARYANFTLGGGSTTVAVLHRELLEKRGWVSADNFTLCFALARLTPGTNLLAFCAGTGWLLRGAAGALIALLAASIPCALMVVAATALFSHWQENHWARTAIHGAIAAAVAITVKTCWTITHPHFKGRARPRVVLIAAGAFLLFVGLARRGRRFSGHCPAKRLLCTNRRTAHCADGSRAPSPDARPYRQPPGGCVARKCDAHGPPPALPAVGHRCKNSLFFSYLLRQPDISQINAAQTADLTWTAA